MDKKIIIPKRVRREPKLELLPERMRMTEAGLINLENRVIDKSIKNEKMLRRSEIKASESYMV